MEQGLECREDVGLQEGGGAGTGDCWRKQEQPWRREARLWAWGSKGMVFAGRLQARGSKRMVFAGRQGVEGSEGGREWKKKAGKVHVWEHPGGRRHAWGQSR